MSSFLRRLAAENPGTPAKKPETARTLMAIAVDAVIDLLLAGKNPDDLMEEEPEDLVLTELCLRDEDLPAPVIEQLVKRLDTAGLRFPTCEGSILEGPWVWSPCSNLVSFEIRKKVQDYTGEEDWVQCEECTCPCMYDAEIDGLDDFCDGCLKDCCSRCGDGCTCPDY